MGEILPSPSFSPCRAHSIAKGDFLFPSTSSRDSYQGDIRNDPIGRTTGQLAEPRMRMRKEAWEVAVVKGGLMERRGGTEKGALSSHLPRPAIRQRFSRLASGGSPDAGLHLISI